MRLSSVLQGVFPFPQLPNPGMPQQNPLPTALNVQPPTVGNAVPRFDFSSASADNPYVSDIQALLKQIESKNKELTKAALAAAAHQQQVPQQNANPVRPGPQALAALLAILGNVAEKGAGTKGFQAFQGAAQNTEAQRFQNALLQHQAKGQSDNFLLQALKGEIGGLQDVMQGTAQLANIKAREIDAQREREQYERQQNEIRGRNLHAAFMSANSISELEDLLDQFQDPAIGRYAPAPSRIQGKIGEIRKREASEAAKVQKAEVERAVDNYRTDYNAAVQAASQTLEGWTPDLERSWTARRVALKAKHGLKDVDLPPVRKVGATSLGAANFKQRQIMDEFQKISSNRNYDLAEQRFLWDTMKGGPKSVTELEKELDSAERNLNVLREQAKGSLDFTIEEKINAAKAKVKVLKDEIAAKRSKRPSPSPGLQPPTSSKLALPPGVSEIK